MRYDQAFLAKGKRYNSLLDVLRYSIPEKAKPVFPSGELSASIDGVGELLFDLYRLNKGKPCSYVVERYRIIPIQTKECLSISTFMTLEDLQRYLMADAPNTFWRYLLTQDGKETYTAMCHDESIKDTVHWVIRMRCEDEGHFYVKREELDID